MFRELVSADSDTTLGEMNFRATMTNGHEISVLPQSDRPHEKQLVLFILPPTAAAEQVTLTIGWQWKKAFATLVDTGRDKWEQLITSGSNIPTVQFTFKVHHDLGPMKLSGKDKLSITSYEEKTYRCYDCQFADVPKRCAIERVASNPASQLTSSRGGGGGGDGGA
jgi:hypothetical protein